ncbi:MAG: flagellar motor switch protein FliN [Armatimonadota bacterium]
MNQMQLLQQIGDVLPGVWSTVSDMVSNSSPAPAKFESSIAMSATPQDLTAELGGNMLMIQFAMVAHPEATQAIIIRTETVLEIARVATGVNWDEVDDNVQAEIRPFAEAIIQGICMGVGSALQETVVATGMSIRYQDFQLPDNLAHSPSLIRTQVALTIQEVSGVVLWLMDEQCAMFIIGKDDEEEFSAPVIPAMTVADGALGHHSGSRNEFDSSMEVLLDVPLEISVELGRMKMMVREVLDLGTGSIIEVDKAAGEPVDVMVNGRLVAKGEVVVIEDNFGVRITEILNPAERFRLDSAA